MAETPEAKSFKALTGVELAEIDLPGKLSQAIAHLKKNLFSRLSIEAESALKYVSYYPERLTSTGYSLVKMLSSIRAMSGTPWNALCCDPSLANNYLPDVGTEGRIAAKALSRVAENKNSVHIVTDTKLDKILQGLLENHPQKDRVRMLMDSGALFKNSSNFEVAKALRDYLKKPILFFTQDKSKGQKTPDTLALLKVGSDEPILIGGSRLEDIERKGLDVKDYFVFLDERHTTGTDVPMIPEAIGLMTIDETMLSRTFFQTILRLRDFFIQQDVEFVIPQHILKTVLPVESDKQNLKIVLGSLLNSIKNQAITKANHFFRSRKQAIDDVFRQELLIKHLLPKELNIDAIKDKFLPFKDVVVVKQTNEPYDQLGSLEEPIDSMASLTSYMNKKLQAFERGNPSKDLVSHVKNQLEEIVTLASKSPFLPSKVLESGSDDLGMEVNVLAQVAAQVNTNTMQEIDIELLEELQHYKNTATHSYRPEDVWEDEMIDHLVKRIIGKDDDHFDPPPVEEGQPKPQGDFLVYPLPNIFLNHHYKYLRDYTTVFNERLLVTQSWVYTTDKTYPVFHKMQRPADAILILRLRGKYRGILLSQNECLQFKDYLERKKNNSCWLVQPNGDLFAGNSPLPTHKDISSMLLQCNVFNGNVDYLDAHPNETIEWLHSEGSPDSKLDFLKLKVGKNANKAKIFFNSELFGYSKTKQSKTNARAIIEKLANMSQEEVQEISEQDKDMLNFLPISKINLIKPEQVAWLSPFRIGELNKTELIQAVDKKDASHLKPEQMSKIGEDQVSWFENDIAKTQQIPITFAPFMSDAQFEMISPKQISQIEDPTTFARLKKEQLAYVKGSQVIGGLVAENQVRFLRRKSAIQALNPRFHHLVSESIRIRYLFKAEIF